MPQEVLDRAAATGNHTEINSWALTHLRVSQPKTLVVIVDPRSTSLQRQDKVSRADPTRKTRPLSRDTEEFEEEEELPPEDDA